MIRFGRDEGGSVFDPRRRPPPNYFSRRVQAKILLLVFLFMGVLALMSEARKPKNWQWMWRLSGPAAQLDGPPGGQQDSPSTAGNIATAGAPGGLIDTRPPAVADEEESASLPMVTTTERPEALRAPSGRSPAESMSTAQLDGWDFVLRRLSKPQRRLLRVGLWRQRQSQSLTPQERAEWPALMHQLDNHWQDYHARASLTVAEDADHLTGTQKRMSIEIIENSKTRWHELVSALQGVAQPAILTDHSRQQLADLQGILDARAFSQIEDNTVLRSAETEAWYRCWEKLQSTSSQDLLQAEGPLTFVQLFAQPEELRGRLIKVDGTARWGYRVDARGGLFGIDGYVVLGLLPASGGASPVVVYCLNLPAGFPDVKQADPLGKGISIDEDVEVTGFFFKRWLHRSEAGMNLSPLILGRVTRWKPHHRGGSDQSSTGLTRRLSWMIMPVVLLAAALLAAGIAFYVYRSSRWSSGQMAAARPSPRVLPPFDTIHVHGNVNESLRKFADEQSARGESPEHGSVD